MSISTPRPLHLDLRKTEGLTVQWDDGTSSFISVRLLRRMSPSADARTLRESLAANPLTVIPTRGTEKPLEAIGAELVGSYAVRIRFNDGHDTGIYSWAYLRELAAMSS